MRKIYYAIFSFFAIFVLFGCTSSSTSKTKEIDIFVGTEGLTAEFAKTAPPPRVFEESDFPILLKIRNKGAYSIASDEQTFGVITIGREKDYIPTLTLQPDGRIKGGEGDNEFFFSLEGKTQVNPNGDEIISAMNAKTGKLEPQSEQKPSTLITATLCYPYKTILSTTVCIDPDVSGIKPGKKVCNVKELSFANGQGAPISVTKIEPQMIMEGEGNIRPQFLIFVENKGKGNPVDINSYNTICSQKDLERQGASINNRQNIWNVAFLKAKTSGREGENQLECTPGIEGSQDKITGFIRFRDKKDFVKCTFKEAKPRNSDAYTSPLKIEIDYGYVQTVAASFIIQKPIRY